MRSPSGEQHELACGELRAVVTEVGATLRELRAGDQPLLWGFGPDEMCSGGRGQVLAPWPNRLEDGHYRFAAHDVRVPLDEPEHHCAIHGLVRWLPWRLEARQDDEARLSVSLHPTPAYPFALRLELTYRLDRQGLSVEAEASNLGDEPLPFGIGFHPYLDPGPSGVDAAGLSVPATQRIPLDDGYMPMGPPQPVETGDEVATLLRRAGGGSSLAGTTQQATKGPEAAQRIGAARLNETLTGMLVDADGRWRARFEPEAGSQAGTWRPIEVWADESYRYCQLFTADTLPGAGRRRAVAVEPMTCPANALRSGIDLAVLGPGERFRACFGIALAS